MVLATDVIRTPSDANQLEPALEGATEAVGPVQRMLADGGYVNAEAIEQVGQKVDLYVAIASADNSYRRYDFRPPKKRAAKKVIDPRLVAMRAKVTSKEGKRIYRKRASTVEPVFGMIKAAMGLRQFLLRGWRRSASSGTWHAWHTTGGAFEVFRLPEGARKAPSQNGQRDA